MQIDTQTPPVSRRSSSSLSSPARRRHSPNLSIDLSDLPPLSQPSPPSNTLIITNLDDPLVFTPTNLAHIRLALDSEDPLYSFSPLKSFRRIICAFYTVDAAVQVRTKLDGETVLGHRIRVYFGKDTQITELEDQHLKAPQSQKLFFISPPPSPPCGWEVRNEDPPNKDVHADDLSVALHRLSATAPGGDVEHVERVAPKKPAQIDTRSRSDSRTMIYHPAEQGNSPDLPSIAVEDTSCETSPVSPTFAEMPMAHTARPPVELMEE